MEGGDQEENFDLLARCEDLCFKGIIMALVTNDQRSKTRMEGGREVNNLYLAFVVVHLVF